jgi:hypothetical protein
MLRLVKSRATKWRLKENFISSKPPVRVPSLVDILLNLEEARTYASGLFFLEDLAPAGSGAIIE